MFSNKGIAFNAKFILLIPKSYKKNIFKKKVDDAFFFNRTRQERVEVVGPEPELLWTGLKALDHRARDRTAAGLVYRL